MTQDNYFDDDRDDMMRAFIRAFLAIFTFMFFLFILSLIAGCKSHERVVVVETVRADTLRLSRNIRDSVWLHDSIYIRDKGDTMFIERWHTRWRDRTVHDTTYVSKTDSVPVPYPVEVKVQRELNWWQRLRMHAGGVALSLLAIWLGIQAWKIYKKKF
jgi:hypothetical protein